ncbi:MAG: hypothetical protein V1914_03225 [archaeon]
MKPELTQILDAEFVPPITEPNELYNLQTKETALTLIKAGQQEIQREIPTYTLPPPAESKDPRSLIRKIGDSIVCTFAPKTKTALVHKRIKEDQLIADAQAQYEWMASSVTIVEQAAKTLHDSYTDIAEYLCTIKAGIGRMAETKEEGQATIEHDLEQILKLQKDLTGSAKEELEDILDNKAAQQALDILERTIKEYKKAIAKTNRDNEYAQELIDYHERLLPACERSLKDMETAIKLAQEQKMDLGLTLTTYKGLTENQINATKAIQFLQDVQTINNNLKTKMRQVDSLVAEKVEVMELTAPKPRQLPVADPKTLKIMAELEE